MKIVIRPVVHDPEELESAGLASFLITTRERIQSQIEKDSCTRDIEKSLLSCLLLIYFLEKNESAFDQIFSLLSKLEIKKGETAGKFYDLKADWYGPEQEVIPLLETALDEEKTMREFFRWQLLMKSMVAFKYERIIHFAVKSFWELTPDKLFQLLDLIVDWTSRSLCRDIVLTALRKRMCTIKRENSFWYTQAIGIEQLKIKPQKVKAMVWDTGIDASCIANLNTDFGLYYDQSCRRTTQPLLSAKAYPSNIGQLNKGLKDLSVGLENEATTTLLEQLSRADKKEIQDFAEAMNFYANYAHGTQVASVLQLEHPSLEIIPVRITFDHKMHFPDYYTIERVKNELLMYREVFELISRCRVRIVNMSWSYSKEEIETSLINNGLTNKPERNRVCEEIFNQLRDGLYQGIQSCPETLFLTGAGNANKNVDDDSVIPSGIELPNLLAVGALNIEGKRTPFTSVGQRVTIYANGENVSCIAPGGLQIRCSGTSYAAPAVGNLAAKLWSVKPDLKLSEIKQLILNNADRTAEEILIVNPRKSLDELLRSS